MMKIIFNTKVNMKYFAVGKIKNLTILIILVKIRLLAKMINIEMLCILINAIVMKGFKVD